MSHVIIINNHIKCGTSSYDQRKTKTKTKYSQLRVINLEDIITNIPRCAITYKHTTTQANFNQDIIFLCQK